MADGLAGPANLPPSSFEGQQFNDNNGCAFMRAGLSGSTVWVARVNQNHEPICGLAPTFGETPVVATAAEPAPAPAENVGAPIPTVASVTTAPRVPHAAPVAAPVAEPAAPRQVTLAEACAGRTGVQSDLISSRNGQPIDCGGAPAAPAVVAEPQQRHMTVAQICAETAATGQVFTNSATGQPVICPATAPVVLAAATTQPAPVAAAEPARMTRAEACALGAQNGVRYVDAATGLPIICDAATGVAGANARPGVIIADVEIFAPDVPASNPVGVIAPYAGPPRGYEPVWTDGRLNPNRGFIPISTSQFVLAPVDGRVSTRGDFMPLGLSDMRARLASESTGGADRVSTQNVPQTEVMPVASQAAAGHRFVQVGTYGDRANANRAAATLQGLGLPVGLSVITRNGAQLQIVSAGPFASEAALQDALRAARAAGYGDAFTRS